MTKEISITISKILNWTLTNCNTRLEVAFYAQATRNYLAHKTTMGYFSNQFLVVNTSFKIHFNPQQHIILCRISELKDNNNMINVGEVQIDLSLLTHRKLIYIPFKDLDKVLEVKCYEGKRGSRHLCQKSGQQQQAEQKREDFLQQRFDFLDKIADHEAQSKKRFSQKVYHLLKEIKTRSINDIKQRQNTKIIPTQIKQTKRRTQIDFRNRFDDQRRKSQPKRTELKTHLETKTFDFHTQN